MKILFHRILYDKTKLFVTLILLFIPTAEVIQIAWGVHQGFSMPIPHYATFLALYTLRHILHKIMFWFLPLFLLIIVNEVSLEDAESGCSQALVVRMGKKAYTRRRLRESFCLSFIIIAAGLILNMILVYFLFQNGDFAKDDWQGVDPMSRDLTRITLPHPVLANLAYILLTAFLSGLIGAVGTALALTIQNRKIVYGLTFLLWFIPVNAKQSLMYVIQPFLFADYEVVVPTLCAVVALYTAVIAAVLILEEKFDKI